MNVNELYQNTPVARHPEIIISGDRLFFDDDEYVILGRDRELKLLNSPKGLEQRLVRIEDKMAQLLTK